MKLGRKKFGSQLNSAARQMGQYQAKQGRERQIISNKLANSVEKAKKEMQALEAKILKDPIDTLGLSYDEATGFKTIPIPIEAGFLGGQLDLFGDRKHQDVGTDFSPPSFSAEGVDIQPIDVLVSRWFTVLSLRITSGPNTQGLNLNWVKKTDLLRSKTFLIDEDNQEYLYPLSTNLRGEVVAGHPRTGLIAYTPFERPTGNFSFHFTGISLGQDAREKHSFSFQPQGLSRSDIEYTLSCESLVEIAEGKIEAAAKEFESRFKANSSGCATVLIGLLMFLILSTLAL